MWVSSGSSYKPPIRGYSLFCNFCLYEWKSVIPLTVRALRMGYPVCFGLLATFSTGSKSNSLQRLKYKKQIQYGVGFVLPCDTKRLPWWRLQCRRPGFDPWVRKMFCRREGLPTPVFFPGEFHRQKSLEGYNPWGSKELDTTKQLTLSLFHF